MRAGFAFLIATTLLACGQPLRVPPPAHDPSGAAGAAGSPSTSYATVPTATGGGLVSGGAAGSVATGGPGFGPGAGGQGGTQASSGGGATGGAATGPGGPPPVSGTFPSAPWVIEGHGKYDDLRNAPIAMSRDGNRVLDTTGLLWIDEGTPNPMLTGTIPGPAALSADGTTVAGNSGNPCSDALTWARGGTQMYSVPSIVAATSADGGTTIGTMPKPCVFPAPALGVVLRLGDFVLGHVGGVPVVPIPGDDSTDALAVSADGTKVIAFSWLSTDGTGRFATWTQGAPVPLHTDRIARLGFRVFASAAASAVAGTMRDAGGNDAAFIWTESSAAPMPGPLRALPKAPSRGQSLAAGLSADGSVVLALGTNAPSGPSVPSAQEGLPYTWNASSGATVLAVPAGVMGFETVLMTPDASLIVGNPTPPMHGAPLVVWDAQRKPGTLFADAPLFLNRCQPFVTHVSADGRTFAGSCGSSGRRTGFVARF
jgi:hypothetical protein